MGPDATGKCQRRVAGGGVHPHMGPDATGRGGWQVGEFTPIYVFSWNVKLLAIRY